MNIEKLGVLIGLLTLTASGFADSYQFEIGGLVGQSHYNVIDRDRDMLGLAGVFHFSPVESQSKPLSEAAFLTNSNSIGLTHTRFDSEREFTVARMEFYVPSAMLYIAPFYLHVADSFENGSESDSSFGVNFGITPMEGLRVHTSWVEGSDYNVNLEAKYVTQFGDSRAINIEVGFAKSEDSEFDDIEDYRGLAVDYFFDPTLSVGAEYRSRPGINSILDEVPLFIGEDTYGVRGEKHFNSSISASARYLTSDLVDFWLVSGSYRF